MSIEAMKLALDCLEDIFGKDKIDVGAINALRQAIAEAERQESDDLTIAYMSGFHDGKNKDAPQPEQKPVAWMREDEDCTDCIVWEQTEEHTIPLYTTPPQRTEQPAQQEPVTYSLLYPQAEYLAQPEQEPVAWRTFDGEGGYDYRSYEDNESYADEWDKRNPNHKGWVDKLYTAAPQRKPCTTCEALARSVMMDQTGRDA